MITRKVVSCGPNSQFGTHDYHLQHSNIRIFISPDSIILSLPINYYCIISMNRIRQKKGTSKGSTNPF